MLKKYQFPMQLYLIFEHLEPIVYTSDNLTANHYVMFIPSNYSYNFVGVLKNEIFFSFNYLAEISAIDTLKYSKFLPNIDSIFFRNRIVLFYIFYTYYLKLRLTLFTTTSAISTKIYSIESYYKNSN
jgi:NADH:ubiquinone oxidoreductase subunit C